MKFSRTRLFALVGLAGAFLVGYHGQAVTVAKTDQTVSVAPNANNKVIIYPTTNETIRQLKEKGIQKVTNYGSYWLVEATDAQVAELTQIYGERAVKENRLNRIQLNGTSFDTFSGEPTVPADLRQEEGTGKRLRLVQYRGPVTPEWMQLLRSSGAQIISYVPNNAYLVFMDAMMERKLEAMHGASGPIQWVGAYHPYYKITPELRYASGTEPVKVRVAVVDRPQEPPEANGVRAMGIVDASLTHSGQEIVQMDLMPLDIARIAKREDVLWIQKVESARLLDEVQDLILTSQTNAPGHGPSTSTGITNYLDFLINTVGGGLASITDQRTYPIVDVADTGLDVAFTVQPSFYEFGTLFGASRVAYREPGGAGYIDAGEPELGCAALGAPQNNLFGWEDFYGHGTLVASVIAGYDTQTNVNGLVCIYSTIVTQKFASTVVCSGTGTDAFTFLTSPCSLVTNIPDGCTTAGQPITTTLPLLTQLVITQAVDDTHQDPSGFQLGLGVSPFGRIGISRIWAQNAHVVNNAVVLDPTVNCIQANNNFPSLFASAYGNGARIQNNSWSDLISTTGDNGGRYDGDSQAYDTAVRDALLVGASNNVPGPSPLNQEFIIVFAADSGLGDQGASGNVGGFGDIRLTAPSTAKNVITVGSADSVRLDGSGCAPGEENNSFLLYSFSAFGPTLDGRFKPEIVAPGTAIFGASTELALTPAAVGIVAPLVNTDPCGNLGGDNITTCTLTNLYTCDAFTACFPTNAFYAGSGLYTCNSGSSFAAPAVSAGIQLLWWYFQNRLTNEVGQALLQPTPAMAKAYLCNSARYLPITNPQTHAMDTLPSSAQGMGEMDLLRMFDGVGRAIRDESSPRAIDSPLITTNPAAQQTYFSQTGQSYELTGQIASNGLPFRVTLAWTDAPGAPNLTKQLINDLDLQVIIGGVQYKGNVFAQNVSVPGASFDSVNNMESVFLNPIGSLGGIAAVTSGAPWQVIVRATNIAGDGVPNVGGQLNQDFALVVYNTATNTLSDVPNLKTNNSCQTALILTQFPFSFTNTLSKAVYRNVHPSPSVARGGIDEFFKIPQPTPGTVFNIDTFGSSFDTVLSVWSVQVVPQTIFVRGDCGALTEVVANNDAVGGTNGFQSQLTFTADGSNDYFIVVEPHNDGPGGRMILNVQASQSPITLTPPSLGFGSVIEGTTSAVQTVIYQNGSTVPVDITSDPIITGPNAGDFLILSQSCGFNTINPGTNCFIAIAFAPTTTGPEQATLVVADNATGSPRLVPLSGIGIPAAPVVCLSSGGPLIFPSQLVSTTGAVQSITVTDCGSTNLNVSSISVSGFGSNDFVVTSTCTNGSPIAPGGTCVINVSFAPQAAGTRQATLTMTDDSAGGPTTVLLQGVGEALAPVICFNSNPVNFGTVFVGTTGPVQSVIITNCGTSPLIISSVIPTGANASDFLTNSSTCATVAPGATCAIGMTFAPTATGTRSAVLTINDNTPGSPDHVSLTGIGSGINCPTITVTPTVLPQPTVGIPYSQSLTANGAKAPVTFILAIGPMPPGLVLTNGVISGTPTKVGQFTFEVGLTDANGCTAQKLYTVFVSCPTITISPSSLPGGTEFVSYGPVTFTASGGTPPFTFTQSAGALPQGMNISSNGVLSGTPTSPSSTFTVTVTDSNNCTASAIYTLTLTDPAPPVTVGPASLPAGVVGRSYKSAITASGGVGGAPYTFTTPPGSLPGGLTLSGAGTLTGVPSADGTFSFTVTATDSGNNVGQTNCTISVTSIADLAVSSSFSPSPVLVSSNLTCTITVANLGPSPATGVIVSNSLPAGAGFVSASAGCVMVGGAVVCSASDLAAGASIPFSYTVTNPAPGAVSATTTVSANETDPIAGNNSAVAGSIVTPPFTVASNPKAIADGDGDIVAVTLKGAGTMEVHLVEGHDPINSIVLTGTDASSVLTIQVKKAKAGDGLVNIGSIVSDGGLKSITGKAVNLTGAGVQLGGSLGSLTVHAMSNSALTVNGTIKTVNVKMFDASMITATQVTGSVKLGTVPTQNGNPEFGIQVHEAGGTLSVSNPHLKGKIASNLSTGNFHVVVQ